MPENNLARMDAYPYHLNLNSLDFIVLEPWVKYQIFTL